MDFWNLFKQQEKRKEIHIHKQRIFRLYIYIKTWKEIGGTNTSSLKVVIIKHVKNVHYKNPDKEAIIEYLAWLISSMKCMVLGVWT